jgi:hypothetical protein
MLQCEKTCERSKNESIFHEKTHFFFLPFSITYKSRKISDFFFFILFFFFNFHYFLSLSFCSFKRTIQTKHSKSDIRFLFKFRTVFCCRLLFLCLVSVSSLCVCSFNLDYVVNNIPNNVSCITHSSL